MSHEHAIALVQRQLDDAPREEKAKRKDLELLLGQMEEAIKEYKDEGPLLDVLLFQAAATTPPTQLLPASPRSTQPASPRSILPASTRSNLPASQNDNPILFRSKLATACAHSMLFASLPLRIVPPHFARPAHPGSSSSP